MACRSKPKWCFAIAGLTLTLMGAISDCAYGQDYTGALITFPTNAAFNPAYIYLCTNTGGEGDAAICQTQLQLTNNGYVTGVTQWNGNQPAPWAFLYTLGTYVLWQQDASQDASSWRSCTVTVATDGLHTGAENHPYSCPGLSWSNSHGDDVVDIALMAADGNGFFIPAGTLVPLPAPQQPLNPNETVPAPQRTITFINKSANYTALCINQLGTFTQTPCSGEAGSFSLDAKGKPKGTYVMDVPAGGWNSGVTVVSGIKLKGQQQTAFIATGQNLNTPDDPAYGARIEWVMYPQTGSTTTGVTTIDVSLVNGYNVGFKLYPDSHTVCSRAHHEGGAAHFSLYSKSDKMSEFPYDGSSPRSDCPSGMLAHGQGPNGATHTLGCYSDCAWATKNSSAQQQQLCCQGSYDNPPGSASNACPTASQIARPYSAALDTQVLRNGYTWAYDDYRGTFTCDGNESYTVEITDFDSSGSAPSPPGGSYSVTPLIGSGSAVINTATGMQLTNDAVFATASPLAVTVNGQAATIYLGTGQVTGPGATGVVVSGASPSGGKVTVAFPGN
ncbi:thaumatin family protein [Candidatus Methylospira mobilis]|uniref:Thaumatin family protein n=1 Tax=Candidatus Methylospira mobilis TaxID=1808979 RepID=A0A5Q0BDF7_9GAMM|nr:thaumatin family protein [Candidatus Methylospira mobilis]QFY41559.1 thaumatin family protein [Candidatus Methylospira mobilis]WNV05200.1 thaumatin family protein [Candidatus Methylospira mobilis]